MNNVQITTTRQIADAAEKVSQDDNIMGWLTAKIEVIHLQEYSIIELMPKEGLESIKLEHLFMSGLYSGIKINKK